MSEAKVNADDYIDFLIATSKHFSGLEASKVQPNLEHQPMTRLTVCCIV